MQYHLTKSTARITVVLVFFITTTVTLSPLLTIGQKQADSIQASIHDASKASQVKTVIWKKGYIELNGANAREVVQTLADLVKIPVVYQGNLPGGTCSGFISYKLTIRGVLILLQNHKIKANYDGKRMIVGE